MSPAVCALLQLPYSLRHQIYFEAGIVQNRCIDLSTHLDGGPRSNGPGNDVNLGPTLILLRTCRTIHDDVFHILYSSNSFFLHYCMSGFQPLLSLTPRILASMTRLEISIRQIASCHPLNFYHDCYERCTKDRGFNGCKSHSEPLNRRDVRILSDWHLAAKHIFTNISPFKLKFGLICDTPEHELDVAERLLEPFSTCPTLEDCKIRLSYQLHRPLADLAKKTALMASKVRTASFRLLDLPDETILRILRYTDLVIPIGLLEIWSQEREDFLRQCRYTKIHEDYLENQLLRCAFEDENSDLPNRCNKDILCFCWRHSAWTRDCYCWRPPAALFLLCRRLTLLSQEVLIKENRMVVEPLKWTSEPQDLTSCPLSLLLGNTLSLRNALHWLKDIEVLMWAVNRDRGVLSRSEQARWNWNVFYPSKDTTATIHVGPTEFTWSQEQLSPMVVETVMSFFPGLELLTGLQRFSLFVRTGFPYVAFERLSDWQKGSDWHKGDDMQRLPSILESPFQSLISQLMEGGRERSVLANRVRKIGGIYQEVYFKELFSNWS